MRTLESVCASERTKAQLKKLLKRGAPHALLFEGPKGVGKGECARAFAHEFLAIDKEESPDIRSFFPEGKAGLHSIDTIRVLMEEATLPSFEGRGKVFILHEVHQMLLYSANALLKTLEEPPPRVTLILTSSHSESLLPTLTSRCMRLSFFPLSVEEITAALTPQKSIEEAHRIALLAEGSLAKARALAEEGSLALSEQLFHIGLRLLNGEIPSAKELPQEKDPQELLSYLLYFYRDLHLLQVGGDPSHLYYQNQHEQLSSISCPLPPLDQICATAERCLRAMQLNLSKKKKER